MNEFPEYPVPERPADYGTQVWRRIAPRIRVRHRRFSWAMVLPAVAALLTLAFIGGMLTERHRHESGFSAQSSRRVLLLSMSDHLERSSAVLADVLNSEPGNERDRARELIPENRLLRLSALHHGDAADAALLADLERALLEVANGSAGLSPIEGEELLFKIRVVSLSAREKGQKL